MKLDQFLSLERINNMFIFKQYRLRFLNINTLLFPNILLVLV